MARLIARNIEIAHGTKRSLLGLGMMWPVTQCSCFVWYFFYCSVVLSGTICVLSLAITLWTIVNQYMDTTTSMNPGPEIMTLSIGKPTYMNTLNKIIQTLSGKAMENSKILDVQNSFRRWDQGRHQEKGRTGQRGDRSVDVRLRLSMFVQCQSGILCGRLTMIDHG